MESISKTGVMEFFVSDGTRCSFKSKAYTVKGVSFQRNCGAALVVVVVGGGWGYYWSI